MAVAAARITVDTTAGGTKLSAAAGGAYRPGSSVLVVAQAAGTLVLGPSGVTAAAGARVPVVAGTVITVDLDYGEDLYAIVASGSLAVDVLRTGV